MARHSADWWAKRLEELGSDGDAESIARRHGVRAKTLLWWRSEIARRARDASRSGPRLLPVVVKPSRSRASAPSDDAIEIVIELGAARVSVRGALTAEHVGAIVGKIAERC